MALKEPTIAKAQLAALGLQHQEVNLICNGAANVRWLKLALADIRMALSVLQPTHYKPIADVFRKSETNPEGLPDAVVDDPIQLGAVFYSAATQFLPQAKDGLGWYDERALRAVASAAFLKTVEEAWMAASGIILPDSAIITH